MPPLPPEPQYQNKTSQEGNGASAVLTEGLDNKTFTVGSTVVYDPVVGFPVRNPP